MIKEYYIYFILNRVNSRVSEIFHGNMQNISMYKKKIILSINQSI